MEVNQLFIGAGCNRIVNNVSWGPSDLVSFGAQNAVAIFCPETAQICTTLPGHKAVVNCTQWIPSVKDVFKVKDVELYYLLSGGADGSIILWQLQTKKRKWRQVLQVPESHKKGVTCITEIMLSQNIAIFASTSSDCTVHIWELVLPDSAEGDCSVSCVESLFVGPKPMVALSLAELPESGGNLALAMGGLDQKLHLYCGERAGKFTQACELKAHTDWIRSLDFSLPIFSDDRGTSIFLVSSSQDRSIRIWKIALHSAATSEAPYQAEYIGLKSYIEGPIFAAGSSNYQVSLESLLIGHEDWVYSVKWRPPLPTSNPRNGYYQPLSILSASMDKTMMIWKPERTTGIWVNVVTVGEISHCALGFYGGEWSPDGMSILAHGYGGSFHLWKDIGQGTENWQPQKVPSGHFSAVTDVSWAKSGEYLLSVSHDQTTRIFAPWTKVQVEEPNKLTWHEIARPQVHGHDLSCVAIIQGEGNHRFVSGADEKVARVFEAPLSFLKTLQHANIAIDDGLESIQGKVHVLGANMSALGLSQKPIYHYASSKATSTVGNGVSDSLETIPDAMPAVLTEPPVEDQLAWHTLWPETHKLYGHGNELYSLTCDHKGKIVASSCKAQSTAVADIWLWEVGSWRAVGRLQSHTLTVTHMAFSFDDRFLLTVSRDRHFSIFSIEATDNEVRREILARQEAHKRIIWACSWNPFCHDFATGSRDKSVKIWGVHGNSSVKHLLTLPQFGSSVTALSWLRCDPADNTGYIAVGMESGLIELWNLRGMVSGSGASVLGSGASVLRNYAASPAVRLDPLFCHVSAVNRLMWRHSVQESRTAQLASCGADNCVRVFEIKF